MNSSAVRPDVTGVLRKEIDEFERSAMRAVEQYTDDQRVIANTSIAEARQHSVVINDRLEALVDDLNAQVVRAREQIVADVGQTTELAYLIVAVAIVLGLGNHSGRASLDSRSLARRGCRDERHHRR